MLKNCKYKSETRCGANPERGLGSVVHCVVCHLEADRKEIAEIMQKHEQRLTAYRKQQQARLDRLRRECCPESKRD